MKQLRYIGEYQPKGMVVEVNDDEVKGLLATGDYEEYGKPSIVKTPIIKPKMEEKNDNSKRTSRRY